MDGNCSGLRLSRCTQEELFFSLGRLGTTSHAMQAATVTGEQPFRSRFFFSVGPTLSAHDAVLTAFPLRNTAPLLLLRLLRRRKRARERESVCVYVKENCNTQPHARQLVPVVVCSNVTVSDGMGG